MKILLIGPYPPPHGGVSVHVSGIHRQLMAAGVRCRVLDTGRDRPGPGFGMVLLRHAWQGWTLHLHTNGHNLKSWLVALGCGLAGQLSGGCILTLHSGMAPGYLRAAPRWRRRLAALVCSLYLRVICVSDGIRDALLSLGLPAHRIEIVPAWLKTERTKVSLDPSILAWMGRHQPLLSTALFFRPEYGFDLLATAIARLRLRYPSVGCLVMGTGEQRDQAERRIRETGLEENVLMLGDVHHDACLALMSASDVFVRPTLEDGDSISVREALSLGVPVVASRTGTRPAAAILFQPGDVEEMLSQIELAMAAKRDGEAPVAGCMDRLMEIYRQVTAPQKACIPLEMSQAIRKLKKLGAMGPRELAHRFREKGYAELERIGVGTSRLAAPDGVGFKSYLAGAPARRFYFNDGEGLGKFVEKNFPSWIDRAIAEAEKLCRHEVELFSRRPVQLGREIDWHKDPLTGRTWERRFWADYQPENDSAGRDPKIIHELNRHQHLPRLAKAYLLTGDERYAGEAVAQLNSWIEQNPPGLGINWQSSLEIAIRAISWLWTLFPLLPSRSLDAASAERIGASLFAQLEHVHRYPSIYSSPNTHLIGEATALFIGGLVFADRKRPAAWLERGAALLAGEAEKQVLDDGVYAELSSYYHSYALDFYLQALTLAQRNQFQFPEGVRHKVSGMLQFLMHLTRPDGTIPLLGDDDGGRALALEQRNYRSFNDALCLGAVLFRREDFKHQAGAFFEETLWLFGEDAWQIYDSLKSQAPAETQSFHPRAGYSIQRSGWGPLDNHLVFDCGGLGMLAGGHAHADALSVVLFSGGRELLVDPGTFVYNGAPEWRNHFRSTRAHNTVTIDDADQAEAGGTFRWKTKLSCRAARLPLWPAIEYIEAEHDGYLRMPAGVVHRRRLLQVPRGYWVMVDDFRGSGHHTFDFNYHFAPGVEVSSLQGDDDEFIAQAEQAGLLLGLYASQPLSKELVRGRTSPIAGWASSGYGEKQPSLTLRASLVGPAPAAAITLLAPFQSAFKNGSPDPVARRLQLERGRGIACAYQHHGFEDIVVFSTGSNEIRAAGFCMQGEFFWLRTEDGILKQVVAMRACSLSHGGRNVFQRSEPGPFFSQSWEFEPAAPGMEFGIGEAGAEEKSICAEFAGS